MMTETTKKVERLQIKEAQLLFAQHGFEMSYSKVAYMCREQKFSDAVKIGANWYIRRSNVIDMIRGSQLPSQ